MERIERFKKHISELNLNIEERKRLIETINQYREERSIEKFVKRLVYLLQPAEKLSIFNDIRTLISKRHVQDYNFLINTYLYGSSNISPNKHHKRYDTVPSKRRQDIYQSFVPSVQNQNYLTVPNRSNPKPPIYFQYEECGEEYLIYNVNIERQTNRSIGFSLRGGSDYGIGIFVSNVEKGSAAEKGGLHFGDRIIEVNGTNFENMTHGDAVHLIRSHPTILLKVEAVGKIPISKGFEDDYVLLQDEQNNLLYESIRSLSSISSRSSTRPPMRTVSSIPMSPCNNNNTTFRFSENRCKSAPPRNKNREEMLFTPLALKRGERNHEKHAITKNSFPPTKDVSFYSTMPSRNRYGDFYRINGQYADRYDNGTFPHRQTRGRPRRKIDKQYRSCSTEDLSDRQIDKYYEVQRRAVSEGRLNEHETKSARHPQSGISTFRNIIPEQTTRYLREEIQKKDQRKALEKIQKKKKKNKPELPNHAPEELQTLSDVDSLVLERKMYIPQTRPWLKDDVCRDLKELESDFIWPNVPANEDLSPTERSDEVGTLRLNKPNEK